MGMLDPRDPLRRGLEAPHELGMTDHPRPEDPHRHLAADRWLVRPMDLTELADADQRPQLVAGHRALHATRDRRREPIDAQSGEVGAEPVPDELVDVDPGIETDDVEAPQRLGGPAGLRSGGERVVGRRRQENLAGMGDGDQPGGTGERRPDRLLVAHLEIAEVDRHPGSTVHHGPGRPNGLDRLGEHDVAGRALRGQLDPVLPVGGGRQLRLAPAEGDLPLGRVVPARQSSRSATSTARRSTFGSDGDQQITVLGEDAPLQLPQLR